MRKNAGEHREKPAPAWTKEVVGTMHIWDISTIELGKEMNCASTYVCSILNGKRSPKGGQERIEAAVNAIVARRQADGQGA